MTTSYVCPTDTSIGPTRSSPRSAAMGTLRNSTLCGIPPAWTNRTVSPGWALTRAGSNAMPYGTRSTIRTMITRGGGGSGGGAGGADCAPAGEPKQPMSSATRGERAMCECLLGRHGRLDLEHTGRVQVGEPPINDGLVALKASLGHHARESHPARLPVDGAVQLGGEPALTRSRTLNDPARLDPPDRVGGLHQAAERLEHHDETAVDGAAHAAGPEVAHVVLLTDAGELAGEAEGEAVRRDRAGRGVGCFSGSGVRRHQQRGECAERGGRDASGGNHSSLLQSWSRAQGTAACWLRLGTRQ